MRSHAKASSAGSTQGQGSRSGSFFRGADATRGCFGGASGSGAPKARRNRIVISFAAAALVLALLAASAFASKDVTNYVGSAVGSGSKGGELNGPRDTAVNDSGVGPANAGDLYVADEANNRIQRFNSSGTFISAWGANATHRDETEKIVLNATSGTYTLSFEGDTTPPIAYNAEAEAVDDALDVLPSIGADANVTVTSTGPGGARTYTVVFTGALSGTNVGQMTADTSSLVGTAQISTVENGSGGGGSDYEVCTLASDCGGAVASGGNATAAGNGSLDHPQSVAVDQDTGNVYVSDRGNRRIDEYDGEGNFIRSFGFDVAESGPGDTGTGYEVCVAADGDVCKVGEGGSGAGQYGSGSAENGFGIAISPSDGNGSTGTVFLADSGNQRVDTYALDGASPASFGSSANFGSEQPRSVAVDSRGIVYTSNSNNGAEVERYDSQNANGGGVGFLAPILSPGDEVQEVTFTGFNTGDQFRLTCPGGAPTGELAYVGDENGLTVIRQALEGACGAGSISATGNPPTTTVTFQGALGGANQPQMTCTTLSGTGSCSVSTISEGNAGPLLRGGSAATAGLAVDPDSDGGGPDVDVLYVLRDPSSGNTVVQQLGSITSPPGHAPGLTVAPLQPDDAHGKEAGFTAVQGLGLNSANGTLYVSATNAIGDFGAGHRVYALGEASSLSSPSASASPITTKNDRSATFEGTVNPNGALADCRFQYSTDEVTWTDAGGARGAGTLNGTNQITSVSTSAGAFTVGQTIVSSDGGIPPNTKIIAVDSANGTVNLSQAVTTKNASVTLTALSSSACSTLAVNGGSQSVSQVASSLVPNTQYFVRLQVKRPFFPSLAPVNSGLQSFTTDPASPLVTEAKARALDSSSMRVSATIDPAHSPTTYVVHYGTSPSLGSSTAQIGIGEGSAPGEVSTVITGLKAATTYYFEVIATNPTGSTPSPSFSATTFTASPSFEACPNDQFRTGPSAKLPDCRAYEQATPTDKFGTDASGNVATVEASRSGDGITSFMLAGFPGGEGLQNTPSYVSSRKSGEWTTQGWLPPPSYGDIARVQAWTPDLGLSISTAIQTNSLGVPDVLLRDSSDNSITTVVPYTNISPAASNFAFGGASADHSKVFLSLKGTVPVTSGPAAVSAANRSNLYLYDRDTGELTLAGLLPDSTCGSPPCVPATGSELARVASVYSQEGANTVSQSGDLYFFDNSAHQLYLRRDAGALGASTVKVSASERTDCADHDPCNGTPEPDPAGPIAAKQFWGATPDGSRAFFTSEEELTDDATTAPGTVDFYRYDAEAPAGQRLIDVAPGADVVAALGASDDGAYAYFVANADLDGAGPAASGNCTPGNGTCNVYLWHDDGSPGGSVTYVSSIDGRDKLDWSVEGNGGKLSRVSADGRALLFRSYRSLAGYDNGATAEFYRYDDGSGELNCVTCNPTGAPPQIDANSNGLPGLSQRELIHVASSHLSYFAQPFLTRNLSADGEQFFFQTAEKLVPADVNGDQGCPTSPAIGAAPACTDAYEWEAPGKGSCTAQSSAYSPANGGCIYLLSTGTSGYPSNIADVSASGDVVFIFTRDQFVPADADSLVDIYAVKVDGGLASQHAVRPPSCEGDSCRGASSPAPDVSGAGSAVFEGPGNPTPKHHKARKKRKHHHHRRAHHRAANHNRRTSR